MQLHARVLPATPSSSPPWVFLVVAALLASLVLTLGGSPTPAHATTAQAAYVVDGEHHPAPQWDLRAPDRREHP
jgi:hypothetical protein